MSGPSTLYTGRHQAKLTAPVARPRDRRDSIHSAHVGSTRLPQARTGLPVLSRCVPVALTQAQTQLQTRAVSPAPSSAQEGNEHMAEQSLPKAKAKPDTQIAVRSSADTSAVVVFQDPRELPLEERLQQAEEHDEKLRHIMDTIPIKIRHLQGSSAGAGSGEFHIYRNARNQEQKRLREMEARWKTEQEKLIVKRKYEDAQQALDTKTAKKRAKRQKRKDKKHAKAAPQGSDDTAVPDAELAPAATTEPDLD